MLWYVITEECVRPTLSKDCLIYRGIIQQGGWVDTVLSGVIRVSMDGISVVDGMDGGTRPEASA